MWAREVHRRSNPTRFCTSDADVKINNSFRRLRVWSERRESQMRLTLGIVNVRSTLQNIISPLLPPRSSWKPSRFGWERPFPRRQQSQGFVHGQAAGAASPASGCAAAGSPLSRAAAEQRGELCLPPGSAAAAHSAAGCWTAEAAPGPAGSALPASLP